jgi:NTE family protein
MDGGIRTADNADLACGCTTVLIISPLGTQGNAGLALHVEVLAKSGALLHVIEPDPFSKGAMGLNPLDPQRRAPAAQAGRQQGRAVADAIAALQRHTSSEPEP